MVSPLGQVRFFSTKTVLFDPSIATRSMIPGCHRLQYMYLFKIWNKFCYLENSIKKSSDICNYYSLLLLITLKFCENEETI